MIIRFGSIFWPLICSLAYAALFAIWPGFAGMELPGWFRPAGFADVKWFLLLGYAGFGIVLLAAMARLFLSVSVASFSLVTHNDGAFRCVFGISAKSGIQHTLQSGAANGVVADGRPRSGCDCHAGSGIAFALCLFLAWSRPMGIVF